MKRFITRCSIIAILLAGAGMLSQATAQNNSDEEAAVTIIEYSDYQCPACAYYHPFVKKIKEKFGDQVKLDLRFFPLNSHQFAALAARAAQSAKNQGKFREMHNLLYENQQRWSQSGNPTPIFVNFARDLNLDIEQFKSDLNSAETQKTVMQEKQEGVSKGVNSTPTFFIDGEQIQRLPRTYADFEKIVQKYLNEKENG